MFDFIYEHYLLIKAFHIISVISWMSGLLYLPRLFVYHTKMLKNDEANDLFKTMEAKLLKIIMLPAMTLSIMTGGLLIYIFGIKGNGWLHAKLFLLMIMLFLHHLMIKYHLNFKREKNTKSEKFFRIFNEIPAILMILIVLLAVWKPF